MRESCATSKVADLDMLFPKYSINYYSNGDSGKKNLTLTDNLCSLLSFSITTNSHFKKFHEKILIVPPSINTSIQKHVHFSVHLYFMAKRLREQWEKFSEWKLLVVVLPSNTFISYWLLSHWKFFLPFKNSIMNLSVSSFVFYCFFLCFAYFQVSFGANVHPVFGAPAKWDNFLAQIF